MLQRHLKVKVESSITQLITDAKTHLCRVNIITVAPADILAFSEECEISKEHAELFLRKFGGDMKSALTAYIRG